MNGDRDGVGSLLLLRWCASLLDDVVGGRSAAEEAGRVFTPVFARWAGATDADEYAVLNSIALDLAGGGPDADLPPDDRRGLEETALRELRQRLAASEARLAALIARAEAAARTHGA